MHPNRFSLPVECDVKYFTLLGNNAHTCASPTQVGLAELHTFSVLNITMCQYVNLFFYLYRLMPDLAQAKIFLTVDLTAGYWHCVLDRELSLLTTFATPFGRYRWRRLPFGLSASSEIFQKRVSQALEGLDGIRNITDDVLVYGVGDTEDEALVDHVGSTTSKMQSTWNCAQQKQAAAAHYRGVIYGPCLQQRRPSD